MTLRFVAYGKSGNRRVKLAECAADATRRGTGLYVSGNHVELPVTRGGVVASLAAVLPEMGDLEVSLPLEVGESGKRVYRYDWLTLKFEGPVVRMNDG
jgi:hypothetical protein